MDWCGWWSDIWVGLLLIFGVCGCDLGGSGGEEFGDGLLRCDEWDEVGWDGWSTALGEETVAAETWLGRGLILVKLINAGLNRILDRGLEDVARAPDFDDSS